MQYGRVIAEGDDGCGLITRLLGKVDRSKSTDLQTEPIRFLILMTLMSV